ncbi:hypothetical protein Tco_0753902 [Tanacetum coccineum]
MSSSNSNNIKKTFNPNKVIVEVVAQAGVGPVDDGDVISNELVAEEMLEDQTRSIKRRRVMDDKEKKDDAQWISGRGEGEGGRKEEGELWSSGKGGIPVSSLQVRRHTQKNQEQPTHNLYEDDQGLDEKEDEKSANVATDAVLDSVSIATTHSDGSFLDAAVVELHCNEEAEIKYLTVQNWYAGNENGKGEVKDIIKELPRMTPTAASKLKVLLHEDKLPAKLSVITWADGVTNKDKGAAGRKRRPHASHTMVARSFGFFASKCFI